MENLQKKLKKFLLSSKNADISRVNVDFCGVSLILLRLLVNASKPVLAALPELNFTDSGYNFPNCQKDWAADTDAKQVTATNVTAT